LDTIATRGWYIRVRVHWLVMKSHQAPSRVIQVANVRVIAVYALLFHVSAVTVRALVAVW
jgi:hypothetical protein